MDEANELHAEGRTFSLHETTGIGMDFHQRAN
jgi:hypothetical protein